MRSSQFAISLHFTSAIVAVVYSELSALTSTSCDDCNPSSSFGLLLSAFTDR